MAIPTFIRCRVSLMNRVSPAVHVAAGICSPRPRPAVPVLVSSPPVLLGLQVLTEARLLHYGLAGMVTELTRAFPLPYIALSSVPPLTVTETVWCIPMSPRSLWVPPSVTIILLAAAFRTMAHWSALPNRLTVLGVRRPETMLRLFDSTVVPTVPVLVKQ